MSYAAGTFLIVGISLLSAGGVFLARRWLTVEGLRTWHDLSNVVFLQVGLLYGVLLAFVVSTVWAEYSETVDSVDSEVSHLRVLLHLSRGFPEPTRSQMQSSISAYSRIVIDSEWAAMARNEESSQAAQAFTAIWDTYLRFEPSGPRLIALYTESLARVSAASEAADCACFK